MGIDVVNIGVKVFGKGSVVSHGNLDGNAIFFAFHTNGFGDKLFAVYIEIIDKVNKTLLRMENLRFKTFVFLFYTFIGKCEGNIFVKKRKLA